MTLRISIYIISSILVAAITFGCATDSAAGKEDDAPKAPEAEEDAEVDPHALCEVYTKIKDARGTPRLAKLREELAKQTAENPADRAAAFGAILSMDDEKDAWKSLRDDGTTHAASFILPLGECMIYGWWKMNDQAEPRCVEAAARLENLALTDVARAEYAILKEDFDKAVSFADLAIATDPACGVAYMLKAESLSKKEDVAGALSSWEGALKVSPSCFTCATQRANLIERSQGQEAALPYWEAALKILPADAKTLQRYAAVQVGRDDAAALQAYEKALTLGKDDFATLMAAASLAVKTGDDAKAIDFAERAARVESAHVDLWRLLGGLYQKRNETEEFEKAMVEVLRLLPDDVEAHLNLARIAQKEERLVDALDHLDAVDAIFKSEKANEADLLLKPAYEAENQALLTLLKIQAPALSGNIGSIQARAQKIVGVIFEKRHKKRKKGMITITVKTHKDGSVEAVNLTENTLGDSYVAASLVGNLRRAQINGGRKLWTLEFDFQ
ncbi:MAG: hypothetical protein GY822_15185 [Deltaproteobacteria bacterium]|nr:hypothetical protein [Deltaproteobacteria bacterium]